MDGGRLLGGQHENEFHGGEKALDLLQDRGKVKNKPSGMSIVM